MVHINMPCLNLGTCSVICVWMCLNLGISSILKQNNANLQAFIDKSLDDVLPKFRRCAKYLQKLFALCYIKILHKREWNGTKTNVFTVNTCTYTDVFTIITTPKDQSGGIYTDVFTIIITSKDQSGGIIAQVARDLWL